MGAGKNVFLLRWISWGFQVIGSGSVGRAETEVVMESWWNFEEVVEESWKWWTLWTLWTPWKWWTDSSENSRDSFRFQVWRILDSGNHTAQSSSLLRSRIMSNVISMDWK